MTWLKSLKPPCVDVDRRAIGQRYRYAEAVPAEAGCALEQCNVEPRAGQAPRRSHARGTTAHHGHACHSSPPERGPESGPGCES